MKRDKIFILNILILIIIVVLIIVFAAPEITQNEEDKIQIIATIFPNYDFAKQIGRDKVEVQMLLDSGVESHTYEPTPKDMIQINNSSLFIYTGEEFEPWAKEILEASENDFEIVDTSKNIELIEIEEFEERNANSEILLEEHSHEEETENHKSSYDSHIWLDPSNAIIMIDNILEKLCQIDPENAEYYINNAENYKKEIQELDEKFSSMVENSKRKEIAFAGEFSYTYFIDKYNLKFVSVYNNCGHGEEPSIAKVKSVIDYINNHDLPVVFYKELSEGTVAKMIEDETVAKASIFYSVHNADIQTDTYINLMERNYKNLKIALN